MPPGVMGGARFVAHAWNLQVPFLSLKPLNISKYVRLPGSKGPKRCQVPETDRGPSSTTFWNGRSLGMGQDMSKPMVHHIKGWMKTHI